MSIDLKTISLVQVIATLTLVPAIALSNAEIKVGSVKTSIPTGSVCVALLPETDKYMVVIPFTRKKSEPIFAWMNINNRDLRLKQVSNRVDRAGRKSISIYKADSISVTIESQTTDTTDRGLTVESSTEKISIVSRGRSQTIVTKGRCIY
jgi:hypothetical protein